jgi:hypothetical protein
MTLNERIGTLCVIAATVATVTIGLLATFTGEPISASRQCLSR